MGSGNGGMTQEQFIKMHEEMGWEIDTEELPISISDLSYNAQQSLVLFNILPDKIEGTNGIWLGKDFTDILSIMELSNVYDKKRVFYLLLICVKEASEHYEQMRKIQEAKAKSYKGR